MSSVITKHGAIEDRSGSRKFDETRSFKSSEAEGNLNEDISAHAANAFPLFPNDAVPVWDLLLCIFDGDSVRTVLSWGVMNCMSAITIVFHTNWLCSAWR